jgi:hypothetical protein
MREELSTKTARSPDPSSSGVNRTTGTVVRAATLRLSRRLQPLNTREAIFSCRYERGGGRIIEACVALLRTEIASMDGQTGYTPETLRRWVRQPSVPAVYVTGNDRRA